MIDILYSGYSYTHTRGIMFDTDSGHAGYDCWLLVFAHSPVTFLVDGELREYPAKTLVLFAPNTRKFYMSPRGEPYKNDWIHFKTDENFILNFPQRNVPLFPSDPDYIHNIIKLISWECAGDKSTGNPLVRDLFHVLISKLSKDLSSSTVSPYQRELLNLRRDILIHPEYKWTVNSMAERLNISAAHLQFLYKSTFDISCIDDVINCRIKLAQDKLLYSTDSISSVGEQCGYHNTEHFCRQFKKITGTTPRKYRVQSTEIQNRETDNYEEAGI